ncbi:MULTISPECIES: glycosyltransferase [Nocardiaceae]|uniref:UDP:flavonoid glycosyltransferase YjiC (YdhE family) n=1 Tax=Rhodococcoides corynebacterioides TaxID=53972 RepID=A0ABS2KU86_9NOCA|nr:MULTISPECIES: nucleotide disphospho-sugar-binding domain-containing protein [Rhodococcus]MBM7414856.1 UDP:flavonoid glycosyltransferase YjiC (YdhE family) [Rhodococcus corynebacterioides]MBP1117318.1 UDP:flavonoid glycosyltransferase YjiC (YdhE family) [Rhodococcus sp. PvP016]
MLVAVVAGPDAGHAFPAIALAKALTAAGDTAVVYTGDRWLDAARADGVDTRLLPGLEPRPEDDDADAGRRIHERAAHMSSMLLPVLSASAPDLVVSDILTAGGGLAAERLGVPWVELSPHPLYRPSVSLPPIGSGLAPGTGLRGRLRDIVMRALTDRSVRAGLAQRARAREGVGLPALDPGPARRLVATIPALEVPRSDWPADARVVGPLLWEPTTALLDPPPGTGPLVLLAPSTAATGAVSMVEATVEATAASRARGRSRRLVITTVDDVPADLPSWAVGGLGRQDALLPLASVVVCGGGHGMLAKALSAGVPVVVIPGGGDQWELANRAARQGSATIVRPVSVDAVADAIDRVLGDPTYAAAAARAAATAAAVKDPVAVCRSVIADSRPR